MAPCSATPRKRRLRGNGHDRPSARTSRLRRRGRRRRSRRPFDRGLCGLRGSFRRRSRCARVRRPGRRQRAHRELFRVSDRDFGTGADRPRLHPGAEVWRRNDDSRRRQDARLLAREWGVRARRRGRRTHSGARSWWSPAARRYRRPTIDDLADFEGRGVWYWASPIEARLCAGEEVVLVGGGNSAGQGAVFLSRSRREGSHDGARTGPCR